MNQPTSWPKEGESGSKVQVALQTLGQSRRKQYERWGQSKIMKVTWVVPGLTPTLSSFKHTTFCFYSISTLYIEVSAMWQTGKGFNGERKQRGKTGKWCRKRETIHQPTRQVEQNCQVGTHGEEGGQQPAAAPPELHLFIPAGHSTHLEVKDRALGPIWTKSIWDKWLLNCRLPSWDVGFLCWRWAQHGSPGICCWIVQHMFWFSANSASWCNVPRAFFNFHLYFSTLSKYPDFIQIT